MTVDPVLAVSLLGAAAFFLFKFLTGFFVHNLSLELVLTRAPSGSQGLDNLSIELKLSKGNMSAITLHDIQYRVSAESQIQVFSQEDIFRFECAKSPIADIQRSKTEWEKVRAQGPKHNLGPGPLNTLSPGEKTSFSLFGQVPSHVPAIVEAVVLARRSYVGRNDSQWRISKVSLPNVENPNRPHAKLTRKESHVANK